MPVPEAVQLSIGSIILSQYTFHEKSPHLITNSYLDSQIMTGPLMELDYIFALTGWEKGKFRQICLERFWEIVRSLMELIFVRTCPFWLVLQWMTDHFLTQHYVVNIVLWSCLLWPWNGHGMNLEVPWPNWAQGTTCSAYITNMNDDYITYCWRL